MNKDLAKAHRSNLRHIERAITAMNRSYNSAIRESYIELGYASQQALIMMWVAWLEVYLDLLLKRKPGGQPLTRDKLSNKKHISPKQYGKYTPQKNLIKEDKMISKKSRNVKKKHVKVLAKAPISSKKSFKIQDCSSVVILDDCDKSTKSTPGCIGCKDDCKYYCQTQSKLNPTPPPLPKPEGPPEDNPCNTTGVRAPGGPISTRSQKKGGSMKPRRKR